MYKKNKLIILDFNLRNLGGHGYKYNTEVAKSAKNKFSTTVIYHHPIFVPPNNFFNFKSLTCLFFYNKLETFNKNSSLKRKSAPKNIGSKFYKEIKFVYKFLNSLFYSIIVLFKEYKNNFKNNCLYQHPFIEDILAIILLSKLTKILPFLDYRFSIILRNTIDEIIKDNNNKSVLFRYLQNCKNVNLYTDSELLTAYYKEKIINRKIITLPIPVTSSKIKFNKLTKEYFTIGFLGPPRIDKGFLLLPDLVQNLIKNNNNVKIRLYIQIADDMSFELENACKKIYDLSNNPENKMLKIEFLKGPLSEESYQTYFTSIDVILILYNDERYKYSTSGIFAESLNLIIPSLCWKETWPSYIINDAKNEKLIIGECIDNIDNAYKTIKSMKSNIVKYKKDLQKYVVGWNKKNNFKEIANYFFESMD